MKTSILLVIVSLAILIPRLGLAQLATTVPTPSPIPTVRATPRPINLTRTFHCNCTSNGRPVVWAGNVIAAGYFQARQEAVGQCLAFLKEEPTSPAIAYPSVSGFGATIPTPVPMLLNPCANCACN